MAVFASILKPTDGAGGIESVTKSAGLAAAAVSSEIKLGTNQLFAIVAMPLGTPGSTTAANINVRFGPDGLSTADATDFGIPVNTVLTFDTGDTYRSLRVYNNCTTTAVDVYVLKLSRV